MKIKGREVLFGCDPETFVFDLKTQQYVGAFGLVPGDKHFPAELEKGLVSVDGLALEFGIRPAANCDEFSENIEAVKAQISKEFLGDRYRMDFVPMVTFSRSVMEQQPEFCLELGCDSDFSAYTLQPNPAPVAPRLARSAGGHLHIGWEVSDDQRVHFDDCVRLVKLFDKTILEVEKTWDNNQERRKIYGRPGAFRMKPYGVEYRTPSCVWASKPELQRLVFDKACEALEQF